MHIIDDGCVHAPGAYCKNRIATAHRMQQTMVWPRKKNTFLHLVLHWATIPLKESRYIPLNTDLFDLYLKTFQDISASKHKKKHIPKRRSQCSQHDGITVGLFGATSAQPGPPQVQPGEPIQPNGVGPLHVGPHMGPSCAMLDPTCARAHCIHCIHCIHCPC